MPAIDPKRTFKLNNISMATGKNRELTLKDCPACGGKGFKKCPECNGKGRPFDCAYCTNLLKGETWGTIPCGICDGKGKVNRV